MTTDNKPLFRVTGRVHQEKDFSLADLCSMDSISTSAQLLACGDGEPRGVLNGCQGVLLTDIINKTEVVNNEHNDTKKMFLVVSAIDGYCTVFSWQELFNTSVGEGVMVILEKEGQKVYEKHGCVDLFSANDFLTGPRYVKKLAQIEIIMVGE